MGRVEEKEGRMEREDREPSLLLQKIERGRDREIAPTEEGHLKILFDFLCVNSG